jgi:pyruvate ferredoxin oxidoreductase gamma subunit
MVPATTLALTHVHKPVPNAALLGGFAALTGLMSLAAVEQAIAARFPSRVAAGNVEAARAAFRLVTKQMGASV